MSDAFDLGKEIARMGYYPCSKMRSSPMVGKISDGAIFVIDCAVKKIARGVPHSGDVSATLDIVTYGPKAAQGSGLKPEQDLEYKIIRDGISEYEIDDGGAKVQFRMTPVVIQIDRVGFMSNGEARYAFKADTKTKVLAASDGRGGQEPGAGAQRPAAP